MSPCAHDSQQRSQGIQHDRSFYFSLCHGNISAIDVNQTTPLCSVCAVQCSTSVYRGSNLPTNMQHPIYQPLLPCVNKCLQYRWDRHCYDIHKKKVQSAKATVSTAPPQTYNHILVNRKKKMLEDERLSAIQRENGILLDKISLIMQTTGSIDCRNEHVNRRLDTDKRQEKLLEIVKENKIILGHLLHIAPHYSVQVWHEEWMKTLYLMDNIGRFPHLNNGQARSGVLPQKNMRISRRRSKQATQKDSEEKSDQKEPLDKSMLA